MARVSDLDCFNHYSVLFLFLFLRLIGENSGRCEACTFEGIFELFFGWVYKCCIILIYTVQYIA